MIAVCGQSVIDRIRPERGLAFERLGGSPAFAAFALKRRPSAATIVTRGATAELREPLGRFGFAVVAGPATRSFVSELDVFGTGERRHRIASFGDPFTPADVVGWMAPGLAGARAVVVGAQWRDDFAGETLTALAVGGERLVLLDGQGPARPGRLGPVQLDGPLDPAWVAGVSVLKCSEEEAEALIGGIDPAAAAASGVPVVVVTLGHLGAVVLEAGTATEVPVEPVIGLADTVGAGDTFLALMAAAMLGGASPIAAAARACDGTAEILRERLAAADPA